MPSIAAGQSSAEVACTSFVLIIIMPAQFDEEGALEDQEAEDPSMPLGLDNKSVAAKTALLEAVGQQLQDRLGTYDAPVVGEDRYLVTSLLLYACERIRQKAKGSPGGRQADGEKGRVVRGFMQRRLMVVGPQRAKWYGHVSRSYALGQELSR